MTTNFGCFRPALVPLCLALSLVFPGHAMGQTGCQFVLGFQALHDLAPADVGECSESQHAAANGDGLQTTTKGLLVWRKADNWTAFTDGSRTWINGPAGLVQRPNLERFAWEAAVPASSAPPVAPAPGKSRLESRTLTSPSLARDMPYTVWLPPGYDGSSEQRYASVYLLHGLGGALGSGSSGSNGEWPAYGLFEALDRLTAAGTIAPLVVVLPQGDQSFWIDAANGGPRYGAYTALDVVADVTARYRTLADRAHRAVGGISMGGFGALSLAMLYPAVFGAAGAHSPALWTLPGPDFFGDAAFFAGHAPMPLLHAKPALARGLNLWLDVGDHDPLNLDRSVALHNQLLADAIPHQWHEWPGAHDVDYWRAHLDDYLRFYDAVLR